MACAAAVAIGTETAIAVGSPGQSAVASALNNGMATPPGAPITSSSNAVSTDAPAVASSISSGRKLKQVCSLQEGVALQHEDVASEQHLLAASVYICHCCIVLDITGTDLLQFLLLLHTLYLGLCLILDLGLEVHSMIDNLHAVLQPRLLQVLLVQCHACL